MALVSTKITAKRPSVAKTEYKTTVSSGIVADLAVVDKRAVTEYDQMIEAYSKLKKSFQNIGDILGDAAKKSTGKLKKQYQRVAKQCTNQGTYCGNRSTQLKELFKYAQLESKIRELEEALDKIQSTTE